MYLLILHFSEVLSGLGFYDNFIIFFFHLANVCLLAISRYKSAAQSNATSMYSLSLSLLELG